jgi:hypothetical protein
MNSSRTRSRTPIHHHPKGISVVKRKLSDDYLTNLDLINPLRTALALTLPPSSPPPLTRHRRSGSECANLMSGGDQDRQLKTATLQPVRFSPPQNQMLTEECGPPIRPRVPSFEPLAGGNSESPSSVVH